MEITLQHRRVLETIGGQGATKESLGEMAYGRELNDLVGGGYVVEERDALWRLTQAGAEAIGLDPRPPRLA